MPEPGKKPKGGLAARLALSLVMTALVLGVLEGGLRLGGFHHEPRKRLLWKPTVAGFIGTHEFYIQTEFSPPGYIWLSQPNTPYTDRYGFRRPEIPLRKPAGKFRVAFLGGSTTQGGYRPYPERAIRLLNAATKTSRYEMLNAACSSYSTHQILIALDRWVLPRDPDLILVYEGWNDQHVQADGYSDHEKDALLKPQTGAPDRWAPVLNNLRVAQLAARLIEWSDRAWPRPRVPPGRFRHNLREIAARCRDRSVPLMIFIRPESRRYPLPPYGPQALAHYSRVYGTTNTTDLYKAIFTTYSTIQREIAGSHEGVKAFDAWAVVHRLQKRKEAGEFGPDVEIWQNDGIHLRPLGEELLAQEVAKAIAPEEHEAIQKFINSGRYWSFLAGEFLNEDQPFEAAYCAQQAAEVDPTLAAEMQTLRARAKAAFEFARLFEEGRWGGSDPNFESKLAKLQQCLRLRPTDFGVVVQIFRACLYSDRADRAAEAMREFQPENDSEKYEWLGMTLQSLLAGQRREDAVRVATEMLAMNPRDARVRDLLRQLQGQ